MHPGLGQRIFEVVVDSGNIHSQTVELIGELVNRLVRCT